MATLILRDTYILLEEEMKSINKLRADTASQIQEAASHGDLKENYEYKAAKEKMEFVVWKKKLLFMSFLQILIWFLIIWTILTQKLKKT